IESLTEYSEWTRRWTKRGALMGRISSPNSTHVPGPTRFASPRRAAARFLRAAVEPRRRRHASARACRRLRGHLLARGVLRRHGAGHPGLAAARQSVRAGAQDGMAGPVLRRDVGRDVHLLHAGA